MGGEASPPCHPPLVPAPMSLGSCWNEDSEKHNSGKKVGVLAEGTECRFKVCDGQAGGSDV